MNGLRDFSGEDRAVTVLLVVMVGDAGFEPATPAVLRPQMMTPARAVILARPCLLFRNRIYLRSRSIIDLQGNITIYLQSCNLIDL